MSPSFKIPVVVIAVVGVAVVVVVVVTKVYCCVFGKYIIFFFVKEGFEFEFLMITNNIGFE